MLFNKVINQKQEMAQINDNSHKGSVLMMQALKKYGEGDFEGGDKDRKLANKYFDMASLEINSESGKITQLYGESRNFGIIYNVFEQNMDNLFETKEGKKVIKEGYELIKKDSILLEQFKIYNFFENACVIGNAKDFVNEALQAVRKFDKKDVVKSNEKFIDFIKKNNLNEYVEIPENIENLYEAIEYIVLNEKNLNNISDIMNAQKVISEHIEKNNKKLLESKNKTNFESFNKKVNDFQENVNENITDDEKKLLETFANANVSKKLVFENYKSEALSKINTAIDNSEEEDKGRWQEIYESVKSKKYSDNIGDNIVNCAEMIEICNTIDN
jgi:hypothetical protein